MLIKMPTPTKVKTIDEPPKEMNGIGSPFVGKRPMETAILIIACRSTQQVIPVASNCPNKSGARRVRFDRFKRQAHRQAGVPDFALRKISFAAGEADGHGVDPAAEQAIGQTGDGVLFVNQCRNLSPCRGG